MPLALFPGTFDPFHNGHLDIAKRALALFDGLVIGVYNLPDKRLLFTHQERIALAEWQGRPPPHDTPLGGMIGIHGIGRGSLKVHRDFNWTEGCVALDNQQIHALARYVRVGMRVIIRE